MERGQMWGNDLGLMSPLCELSLLWREGPGTTATPREAGIKTTKVPLYPGSQDRAGEQGQSYGPGISRRHGRLG